MSAAPSDRPVSRLEKARAELQAARAEHTAAFSADGFDPKRADRAEARLEAAQAAFEDEIEWDRGQSERRNREEKIACLERQLHNAERGLRVVEWKLLDACRALSFDPRARGRGLTLVGIQEWIIDARGLVDGNLGTKSLALTKRRRLEERRDLLSEAEYRLDPVIRQTEKVERLRADIALLQDSQAAAK
ncbi:hypothetical protein HZA87_01555 [Candidatus Uhrbacteria bacterium]|nr:hypothetical protein [Candidatus Uhrbacteria bacterium]